MKLNRPLQLKILESLRNYYPSIMQASVVKGDIDENLFIFNLVYLEEHELVELDAKTVALNAPPQIYSAKITAKGLDFLEDDGGLGAILNTITIKFDPDDLRQLLFQKIEKNNIPEDTKETIKNIIKNAPADSLKVLYTKLVGLALDKVPDVYRLIQTWTGQSF